MSRIQISSQASIDRLVRAEHQVVDIFGNVEVRVPEDVEVYLPGDIYWDVSGEGLVRATSGRLTLHGDVAARVTGDAVVLAFDNSVVEAAGEAHVQLFDTATAYAHEHAQLHGTSDTCRAYLLGRGAVYANEIKTTHEEETS